MSARLSPDFYQRENVVQVARDLLGKVLITRLDGKITSGKIVETEAYAGVNDRASHAWNNRRTKRNEVMYGPAGHCYVYFIYGMYNMFNVVTNLPGMPHAILIRAIEPIEGIETMLLRRGLEKISPRLTCGPGLLTKALGITRAHSGLSLFSDLIWIEDRSIFILGEQIVCSTRVGVGYAGKDRENPWRFRIKDNPWVSPAK